MIGIELKRARLRSQLSQEELAHRANMDRSHISDLECGKKSPTIDTVFRLCDVMQVSPSNLVARVERQLQKEKLEKKRSKPKQSN